MLLIDKIFHSIKNKLWQIFFSTLYYLLKIFIKKPKILGIDYLKKFNPPFIFVSNHSLSYGPIITYLFLPYKVFPWVISYMTEKYYCRKHLEKDFVRKELKLFSPFAEIIAFILEFISIALMNYVKAIPVYKNSKRIIETLNLSLDFLKSNKNIIIFPEQESNSVDYQIVQKFQTGFIKLSKIYYEKTGKKVPLVPISINKKCNFIKIGKIIYFNPKNNFLEEKKRILNHLRNEIIKNIEN